MNNLAIIISKVKSLRRPHNYCDDSWYSCPKDIDGCANEAEGDECNCGADTFNKVVDEIVGMLEDEYGPKELLEDGFGNSFVNKCFCCGEPSMEIVRPGKIQCKNCG